MDVDTPHMHTTSLPDSELLIAYNHVLFSTSSSGPAALDSYITRPVHVGSAEAASPNRSLLSEDISVVSPTSLKCPLFLIPKNGRE